MAITRSQQAKQMLQDGGMLVKPGFGGMRQGYRGDDAYGGGGDKGGGDKGGGDNRSDHMGSKGKQAPPGGLTDQARGDLEAMTKGLSRSIAAQNRAAAFGNFKAGLKNIFDKTLIGRGINVLGKAFGPKGPIDPYSGGRTGLHAETTDTDDDDRGGGDGVPLYAQLGYPSQQAYMAAMQLATQAPAGLPAAVQPMQTMDLNRIAYRFMADGGFLDDEDEPRQAYGLGSIVKKAFKTVRKPFKAVTKTLKKVAKSPLGKIALAVAAPYALGPAVGGSQFLAGLSAAQKAALISGATTGITQLASGEDLDFKDIALSAAIGGTSAKFFPPGGAPKAGGIDPSSAAGQARVASDISAGAIPDRAMGQIASRAPAFTGPAELGMTTRQAAAAPSVFTRPTMADVGVKGMPSVKQSGLEKLIASSRRGLGKAKDLLIMNKDRTGISPLKLAGLAGLAGLATAKGVGQEEEFEEMDRGEGIDIAAIRRRPFDFMAPRFAGSEFDFYAADGGRIGYEEAGAVLSEKEMKKLAKSPLYKGFKTMYSVDPNMAKENDSFKNKFSQFEQLFKKGYQEGGKAEPVAKKVMPLLDMGGMEKDYREDGGFVPIGRMEKADDVPARLSKNEFVFTADAVRNAGDGDVDKGAEVMYNMMKNLEAGGDVSEESQGLEGARRMFQTSQRLEEVL